MQPAGYLAGLFLYDMVSELLKKYIWLIQTLIRAGERGLSLEELATAWESRFGTEYARRTFNNHRESICDLFNIRIECNRSTRRYYIAGASDLSDRDDATSWMINTFTVNEMLTMSKERLTGRVSVEDIPSGQVNLIPVMEAMNGNRVLKVTYRKYVSSQASVYTLHPYALKEYARRWYLAAYCVEKDSVRVYGLDRIISLEDAGERFNMPRGFDVDTLFATNYGVYLSKEKPVEIVFSASEREAGYLRDLPIHPSQKEISRSGERITFAIFVRPNESLSMELFRLGSRIQVISPDSIREKLREEAEKVLAIYSGR